MWKWTKEVFLTSLLRVLCEMKRVNNLFHKLRKFAMFMFLVYCICMKNHQVVAKSQLREKYPLLVHRIFSHFHIISLCWKALTSIVSSICNQMCKKKIVLRAHNLPYRKMITTAKWKVEITTRKKVFTRWKWNDDDRQ